jgi:hypothetical protein
MIVSGFYAVVIFALLMPGYRVVARLPLEQGQGFEWWGVYGPEFVDTGLFGFLVGWGILLVGGQALLLFLSVDSTWRRLKPRLHVAISAALTGFLFTLLAVAGIFSLAMAFGEDSLEWTLGGIAAPVWILILWAGSWAAWGSVFYRSCRGGSLTLDRAVSWLLKGSVLELLIAVPAHVIVRSRGDCSAPILTSWGIVTGIAIMLMCFGPGVLALYKKRLDAYGPRRSPDEAGVEALK